MAVATSSAALVDRLMAEVWLNSAAGFDVSIVMEVMCELVGDICWSNCKIWMCFTFRSYLYLFFNYFNTDIVLTFFSYAHFCIFWNTLHYSHVVHFWRCWLLFNTSVARFDCILRFFFKWWSVSLLVLILLKWRCTFHMRCLCLLLVSVHLSVSIVMILVCSF